MAQLKASQQGIAKIKQARNEKGWTVDDPRCLVEASKVLEPKKIWQEGGPYADGCSEGNWKRFLYGTATVNTEVFKAFCRVLGVSWEEIVDRTVVAQDFAVEHTPDKWQEVCRRMLLEQKWLSSNKLMRGQRKRDLIEENIYVDLTLVQQEQIQKVGGDSSPEQGSLLYESTGYSKTERFEYNQFLTTLLSTKKNDRIAIIGEPGGGKTTLLQKIAFWLLDNTDDLVIWVSLGRLATNLIDYIFNDWLRDAEGTVTEKLQATWRSQLEQRQVWLLLDGLDEMAAEMQETLSARGLLTHVRIVTSCRLNVWQANPRILDGFEFYITQPFTFPQVQQFIEKWFSKDNALGDRLWQAIHQPGKERIKDLARNPLRLTLLCAIWQGRDGDLPDTKAKLYQKFVEKIFDWKSEYFRLDSNNQERLNAKLGELAREAIDKEPTRFRLRHKFVCQLLGKPKDNDSLLQLALDLGWLNQVGMDADEPEEPVYAFWHPTFQEYFAACTIEDWNFFLNHIPDNPKDSKASYRIFERQWKEVILLWLGREDVRTENKEAFIKALVEFQDGCRDCILDRKGFYEYRAYCLAAIGIAEFKECSCADAILSQLMRWAFGYFNLEIQMWVGESCPSSEAARAAFQESDRSRTIPALINLMLNSTNAPSNGSLADMALSLGKIGTGNQQAIDALINLIRTTFDIYPFGQGSYIIDKAFNSLEFIGQNNQQLIDELNNIMQNSQHEYTCVKAAECLGKISPGNEQAIARLVALIEKSADEFIPSEAGLSLTNIAPDHPQACRMIQPTIFDVVWQLLHWLLDEKESSKDELKRRWAEETFEHICYKSPKAIQPLIDIIHNSPNEGIFRDAVRLLGEFGTNDKQAVALLIELSRHSNFVISNFAIQYLGNTNVRQEEVIKVLIDIIYNAPDIPTYTAYSLGKILKKYPLSSAVSNLKHPLQNQIYTQEDFDIYHKCYEVLSQCTQTMPFPDYYEAWHS
ncbi:NACHT domain-containing protein [Microcoleus sp. MON1_C1]|uniref:HEAT repeat domain-containing protein n=1 Tax=Microcoleus sp. MON1_C1 TaxID=2818827 RepID=UPI002FD3DD89